MRSVTVQRQVSVWLGVLAVLIAFMWVFADILLPFIAGIVLAYFLDPGQANVPVLSAVS